MHVSMYSSLQFCSSVFSPTVLLRTHMGCGQSASMRVTDLRVLSGSHGLDVSVQSSWQTNETLTFLFRWSLLPRIASLSRASESLTFRNLLYRYLIAKNMTSSGASCLSGFRVQGLVLRVVCRSLWVTNSVYMIDGRVTRVSSSTPIFYMRQSGACWECAIV